MFIRRDRRGFDRYTWWKVGLVFAAAGVWLAGVLYESRALRIAAIVLLIAAFLLRIPGRRQEDDTDHPAR